MMGSAVHGFALLLWPRWREAANTERHRGQIFRLAFFGALGVGFMVGGFIGARWLFERFLEVEFLAELLIKRVLSMVLLFFASLLVFSSTITAFSTYFMADDLQLLVSSPIPTGRLYLARLADTWLQSSWMMIVFALPIVAGCGPVLDAPWWFYGLLPVLIIPLTVVCSAVGTVLALLLGRILPARRTRDVLVVLALITFLVAYVAFRLIEPEQFINPQGFDRLVSLIENLRTWAAPVSPSDWVVLTLFALLRDDPRNAILPLTVLFTAAPAACALGAWIARGVYLRAYSLAQEGRAEGSVVRSLFGQLGGHRWSRPARMRIPRSPLSALCMRDTRTFLRTTGQWSQLLLISALVVVYVFNFRHFKTLEATGIVGPTSLFFLNVLLGGFVVTTIAVRFLYPAVSLEGRAFWAVQVAPITNRQLLRAKVRWGFWPLLLVAEVLAVASNLVLELSAPFLLAQAVLALVMTYALTGMSVGMGAMEPRFDVANPAKIASGIGGVLFMLTGVGYLVVTTAMLLAPVYWFRVALETSYLVPLSRTILYVTLVVAVLVVSLVAHHLPLWLGARKLDQRAG